MLSPGSWRVRLGLWPRIALAISLGFISLFAALAFLAERALEDSAERILEERLVIAQMAASQIDALLQEAVAELERDVISEPYYDATIQRGMVAIAVPVLGDEEITSLRVG